MSGFVVPMHEGACETGSQIPRANVGVCCPNARGRVRTVRQISRALARGIRLPASHAPSCIGTTNPSRASLSHLNILVSVGMLTQGLSHQMLWY